MYVIATLVVRLRVPTEASETELDALVVRLRRHAWLRLDVDEVELVHWELAPSEHESKER